MASRYRTVSTSVWFNPWFRGLGGDEQRIWLYILTNPETDASGLYRFDTEMAGLRLGLSVTVVVATLEKFASNGRVVLGENWWLLVPNYLKYQPSLNTNVWKSVLETVCEAPETMRLAWWSHNSGKVPESLSRAKESLSRAKESLSTEPNRTEPNRNQPRLSPHGLLEGSSEVPLPDVVGGFFSQRKDGDGERQRLTTFVASQVTKLSPTPVRRALAELADGLSQGQSPANLVAYLRPILKRHAADWQREVSQRKAQEAERAARERERAESGPPPDGMADGNRQNGSNPTDCG